MAQLLEWHRREEKAAWWEYFRLLDLPLEDYADERSALAGLAFHETVGGTAAQARPSLRVPAAGARRAPRRRGLRTRHGQIARQDRRHSTSPLTRSTSSTRAASRTCGPSASSSGAWCRRGRSLPSCSRSAAGSRPTASTRRVRIARRATCCCSRPPRLVLGSRGLAAERGAPSGDARHRARRRAQRARAAARRGRGAALDRRRPRGTRRHSARVRARPRRAADSRPARHRQDLHGLRT